MVSGSGSVPAALAAEEFRRVELKFLISPAKAELVRAWLNHCCRPAAEFPVSQVTSCYYDTADWDGYFESVDGDFSKQKVRLRWYDALPASGRTPAFLEVKEKEGFETWKRRIAMSLDAPSLAESRFEEALSAAGLEASLAGLGVFDSEGLQPAVVVTYRRHRLLEPSSGLGLSLDTGIEAVPVRAGRGWPTVRLPSVVLEVKGRIEELPPRLRSLRRFAPLWSSHSKYSLAVDAVAAGLGPAGP